MGYTQTHKNCPVVCSYTDEDGAPIPELSSFTPFPPSNGNFKFIADSMPLNTERNHKIFCLSTSSTTQPGGARDAFTMEFH